MHMRVGRSVLAAVLMDCENTLRLARRRGKSSRRRRAGPAPKGNHRAAGSAGVGRPRRRTLTGQSLLLHLRSHIRRLRLKLGPARHHVETIVGLGYRFVAAPGSPVH